MFKNEKYKLWAIGVICASLVLGGVLMLLLTPSETVIVTEPGIDHNRILFETMMIENDFDHFDVIDRGSGKVVHSFDSTITVEEIVDYFKTYEFKMH